MSAFDSGPSEGFTFLVKATGELEGRSRVAVVELTVLDTVVQKRCEMDTLNWCGSRTFVVGGLEAARALHAQLGKQIESWTALAEAGHITFK